MLNFRTLVIDFRQGSSVRSTWDFKIRVKVGSISFVYFDLFSDISYNKDQLKFENVTTKICYQQLTNYSYTSSFDFRRNREGVYSDLKTIVEPVVTI